MTTATNFYNPTISTVNRNEALELLPHADNFYTFSVTFSNSSKDVFTFSDFFTYESSDQVIKDIISTFNEAPEDWKETIANNEYNQIELFSTKLSYDNDIDGFRMIRDQKVLCMNIETFCKNFGVNF